jgi:hypothetical protein
MSRLLNLDLKKRSGSVRARALKGKRLGTRRFQRAIWQVAYSFFNRPLAESALEAARTQESQNFFELITRALRRTINRTQMATLRQSIKEVSKGQAVS